MSTHAPPVTNRLIARLPARQRRELVEGCELVELAFDDVLCVPARVFSEVYFPLTANVALLVMAHGHPALQLGMVGNEGLLGATLVLGLDVAPWQGQVQQPGTALRMTAVRLRRAIRDQPALRRLLNRYLFTLSGDLLQTAACNTFHQVEPRLARWLLMSDDRCHADRLELTHQFLADKLGVQRSAITIAAGTLRDRRLIRYSRGAISILDRRGLEAMSCGCYTPGLPTAAS